MHPFIDTLQIDETLLTIKKLSLLIEEDGPFALKNNSSIDINFYLSDSYKVNLLNNLTWKSNSLRLNFLNKKIIDVLYEELRNEYVRKWNEYLENENIDFVITTNSSERGFIFNNIFSEIIKTISYRERGSFLFSELRTKSSSPIFTVEVIDKIVLDRLKERPQ